MEEKASFFKKLCKFRLEFQVEAKVNLGEEPQSRVGEINLALQQDLPVYRLRKIGYREEDGCREYAYAVSLRRDFSKTEFEQGEAFYDALEDALEDEGLLEDEACLRVEGEDFTACYYVEIWHKRADQYLYWRDGRVYADWLRRRNCEEAALIFKRNGVDPISLLDDPELLQECKNHADRYATLAKHPELWKL